MVVCSSLLLQALSIASSRSGRRLPIHPLFLSPGSCLTDFLIAAGGFTVPESDRNSLLVIEDGGSVEGTQKLALKRRWHTKGGICRA